MALPTTPPPVLPPEPTPQGERVSTMGTPSANLAAEMTPAPTTPAPQSPANQPTEQPHSNDSAPVELDDNLESHFTTVLQGGKPDIKVAPAPKSTAEPSKATEVPKPPTTTQPVATTNPPQGQLPAIELKIGDTPVAKPANGRDYSGLTEQETAMFKKMSNDAYDYLRPIYSKYKELSTKVPELESKLASAPKVIEGLPANYYEHPNAYTLTPAYQQQQQSMQRAQVEHDYWTQQLEQIEAGKEITTLALDQQGNYVAGQKMAPTAQAKAMVLRNLSQTQQWYQQSVQTINGLAGQHQQQYQQANNFIKQVDAKFFPFFQTDKHEYVPLMKQVKDALPTIYQEHPLVPLVTKSYATIMELTKQLNEAKAAIASQSPATAQQPSADASKAGPTASTTNAAVATSQASTEDEMNANLADIFNKTLGKKVI